MDVAGNKPIADNDSMDTNGSFDLIILGGGPGGYVAAIRAAELGLRTALVEAGQLGGVCLNCGCIPSKTLIASAAFYEKAKHASRYGVHLENLAINFPAMQLHKDRTIEKLRRGVESLLAAHKISIFRGFGKFVSPNEIKVLGDNPVLLRAESILIATGSAPKALPHLPFDGKQIHDSTSFLNLEKLPKSLLIVGGGIIGCEFASLMRALDVDVHLVELMPRLLPLEAENVAAALTAHFKKQGIHVHTGRSVENLAQFGCELALVAVGRRPLSDGIGLDRAGVAVDPSGTIAVSETMQTSAPHIYAIGDVTGKCNLAHVASHQGLVAVEHLAGKDVRMRYGAIPSVIFTQLEIATCGLSREQAEERGLNVLSSRFPFSALGKAQAIQETEGFVEFVTDPRTGEILGGQVVGEGASLLIAEIALAMENELTVESVSETIHAHPTLAEGVMEAALLARGLPLHLPPKVRP